MEQQRKVYVPQQYITKRPWTNDEGLSFRIISCIDLTDNSLSKLFVPPLNYSSLGFPTLVKNGGGCIVTESVNDDDRATVVSCDLVAGDIAFLQ